MRTPTELQDASVSRPVHPSIHFTCQDGNSLDKRTVRNHLRPTLCRSDYYMKSTKKAIVSNKEQNKSCSGGVQHTCEGSLGNSSLKQVPLWKNWHLLKFSMVQWCEMHSVLMRLVDDVRQLREVLGVATTSSWSGVWAARCASHAQYMVTFVLVGTRPRFLLNVEKSYYNEKVEEENLALFYKLKVSHSKLLTL